MALRARLDELFQPGFDHLLKKLSCSSGRERSISGQWVFVRLLAALSLFEYTGGVHPFLGGYATLKSQVSRSQSREHVFHESFPVGADVTSEQLS
jgi:hypothetical protein